MSKSSSIQDIFQNANIIIDTRKGLVYIDGALVVDRASRRPITGFGTTVMEALDSFSAAVEAAGENLLFLPGKSKRTVSANTIAFPPVAPL